MHDVTNNKISMTRGDTFVAQVTCKTKSGDVYTPVQGDVIKFYVKHDKMNAAKTAYIDANPVITKEVPIDTMLLTLVPTDTKNLDFGNYVYDLELTYADGTVDTFIAQEKLKILPESN